MKHILVAKVENKPGVLNRVASLFRRRNFNISSLTVGETEVPEVSRMTIAVDATKTDAVQVERNLYKLVNVIEVEDIANKPAVVRDLVLIKIETTPETRREVLQLIDVYQGKVVDVTPDSVIAELTGKEEKVQSFVDLMRPFGIVEMVRTGLVAMARGGSNGTGSQRPVEEYATTPQNESRSQT